jgi:peptidoglycan/xylan/chitin deacetylase (PgdA/CDA1 family)
LHGVRAAFFCSGHAAEKYPGLMDEIRSDGHIIGNHGYSHLDGWCSSGKKYREDVERAVTFTSDTLFRPPFGHLTPCQFRILSQKFSIILWDIMPYDFDTGTSYTESLNVLKSKIRKGSIIVLHDRPDSSAHKFLDQFISWTLECGYRFVPLP